MMGLGYLGNGGSSSSSSNLSPLAPPFTVDRSNPKPNSNPLVHFTEPPYASPFSSSLHNWQYSYSSASGPDFFSNRDSEVDSTRTTSLPSANDYCYMGSESIKPPSTHWPTLDPSTKTATDSFSYHGEPKPYYPPYISPVGNDDIPLVALKEPSFDLLSTSGLVPMDGSSQVDYTQSLSGLEYNPQWGGFWNGLAEGKRGKWMEADGSFCSENSNVAGSLVYKNYMKQGAGTAESLNKRKGESSISHGNYADVFVREDSAGSLSTGQLDDKSFLAQNLRFIPVESSKTPISITGSVLPESHTKTPSLESATNSRNLPKPYSPYEKRFQLFDSCTNDCISVTKSSPALVIKPPVASTTFSAPNTVTSKTLDISNFTVVNTKDVDNRNFLEGKAPHLLLGSDGKEVCLDKNQNSFFGERNDQSFIASSSTKEELSNKWHTKNALDLTFKERSGFQVPDINVPDGLSFTIDRTETFKSTANSSESLDSPCWKGAPAAHFFSFGVSEAVTSQHLMKKLEACNDSVKASSQELCEISIQNENVCVDDGLSLSPKPTSDANFPVKEHKSGDAMKAGSDCAKLSSSKGVRSFSDIDKPRKEYDLPNASKSDSYSKASHTKQLSLEEDCFKSIRILKSGSGVVDSGINTSDASEDDYVPFHAVESVSFVPSGEEAAKLAKLHGRVSTPKMNVQMVVSAMHNLSELLLFHCSNGASALNDQDHDALKHVICNLDACMSKNIVPMAPIQDSMFPQQGTSLKREELPDLHMVVSAGMPQVTQVAANFHGQLDCQCLPEQKRNYDVSGERVQKVLDFVSLSDDADISKDHNMVQAIKKVLDENFQCEEELQQQPLLYKNLWLEAEAELCSTSYRARFDRMKIEMEKLKLDKAKESASEVEKLSSSKVSPDANMTHKAANDGPTPNTSIQDSPISSSTSHVDDVEASVMARFHILKCRGDNLNATNVEAQNAAFSERRNHRSIIGDQSENKNFDVAVGSCLQHHTGNGHKDSFGSYMVDPGHETVKEFRVCVTDDPMSRINRVECDNSSLDWEHVLKDEFAWQNQN